MTSKRNEALQRLAENITPADAAVLLESLRWKVDTQIVNCFDERVWLGPCFDAAGKQIGITDCCNVDDPCERHAAMSA